MFLCFGKYVFQGRAPQHQAREAWEFSRWPRALGAEARGDNTKKRTPTEIEGVDLGKRPKRSSGPSGWSRKDFKPKQAVITHFRRTFFEEEARFPVAITSVDGHTT